jgi:2-polyprenyl-3-methyl-5-hydroxy-6-metoxy-1,4-benzoquinol methylase
LSSVAQRYQGNYDKIAKVHVDHWLATGANPFQDPLMLKANEDATVALIEQYAPTGPWLDAGCGMGDLLLRFPDRDCYGIDISDVYIDVARERGLWVWNKPVEDTGYQDEQFDVVTACDILEHVLDVNAAVRELLRVLRPGGVLIARVPDMEPVEWEGQTYEFVHLRIFDEGTLRILLGVIFDMDVLECLHDGNTIHIVARKQ